MDLFLCEIRNTIYQLPALRLRITGQVQGVFFRARSKEQADLLGIKGWVRNLEDGSVEIDAEGSADQLKIFTEWCHHGPPSAIVDHVEAKEVSEEGQTSFTILPS